MASESIEPNWRRSTHCDTWACLETAVVGDVVLVCGSERGEQTLLRFPASSWRAFIAAVRAGEFDGHPA